MKNKTLTKSGFGGDVRSEYKMVEHVVSEKNILTIEFEFMYFYKP